MLHTRPCLCESVCVLISSTVPNSIPPALTATHGEISRVRVTHMYVRAHISWYASGTLFGPATANRQTHSSSVYLLAHARHFYACLHVHTCENTCATCTHKRPHEQCLIDIIEVGQSVHRKATLNSIVSLRSSRCYFIQNAHVQHLPRSE